MMEISLDRVRRSLQSTRVRVQLGACAGLFVAAVVGWTSAGQGNVVDLATSDPAWVLPVWTVPNVASDQSALAQRRPWGQAEVNNVVIEKRPSGPPPYKLVGIVKNRGADIVVVAVEGAKSPEFRGLGDVLSDGAKIILIDATGVTLEKDGVQTVRRLFRLEDVKG